MRQRHVAPLLLAALLAACATPAPELPAPDPLAVTVPEPPPGPPPEPVVIAPSPVADTAFPPDVAASLEALPPPADDLWDRIRKGFAMPTLDDPLVAKWEEWYSSRPDYVARMVDRSRRYLYYIVVEVEERGMPAEIALLPMIESAYNPNALSTSRASGIWQFIPSTGKFYGMKQSFWFDARRDVVAGTEGALAYLTKLHGDFDDWQLALAAYNWGEGNVAKAIALNQKKGRPIGYSSLKMPDETRNYLPKLQAVKNIVSDPAKYGLVLEDIPDAPYFTVVKTTKRIDVKRAAELAEMPLEEFQFLNPHFNRPVIAGADEYTILLPIDTAELFAAKLDLTDQPLVSWQAYRMRNGETLPQVAAKFGLPVEALRAVNGLGAKAKLPAGHTLLVPSAHPSADGADGLAQAVFTTVPQGRHLLLPRQARRHARADREPVRRERAGPQALERNGAGVRDGRSDVAHHERSRAECGQGEARDRAESAGAGDREGVRQERRDGRRGTAGQCGDRSEAGSAQAPRRRGDRDWIYARLKTKQATRSRVACFSSAAVRGGLGQGLQLLGGLLLGLLLRLALRGGLLLGRLLGLALRGGLPLLGRLLGLALRGGLLLGRLLRGLALRRLLRGLALRGLALGRLLRALLLGCLLLRLALGRLLGRRRGRRHHRHNVCHLHSLLSELL